jgi:dethiobiotin synthetase
MIGRINIPGLFVTATDTGVGKTVIAGAIAHHLARHGVRVAVCKIAATGCVHRREGLVSEDAEYLAACADAPHSLETICPQCFIDPLAPAVSAEREKRELDWSAIDRALQYMARDSQAIIVEGVGGIMVPMDRQHTVLDVAAWLGLPSIIVARPALGTINHTLLTAAALKGRGLKVKGVVINRYPTDTPGLAEETNPRAIEKYGKLSVLTIVPESAHIGPPPPLSIVEAIDRVDWREIVGM